MKKRLLSLISVLALVISNFAVIATAEEPAVAPTVGLKFDVIDCDAALSDENYDDEYEYEEYWDASVYAVKITLTGASKKTQIKNEEGVRYAFSGTFVDTIQSTFKYTLPEGKELVNIKQDLIGAGTKGSKFEDGVLTFSWTDSTPLKEETLLATLYFVMADKSDIDIENDITIKVDPAGTNFMQVSEYYDGTTETKYVNIKVTDLDIVEYPEVTEPVPGTVTEKTALEGSESYMTVVDDNKVTRFVAMDEKTSVAATAASVLKATYAGETKQANLYKLLGVEAGAEGDVTIGKLTVKIVLPTSVITAPTAADFEIVVE